jgi:hypothetical protein
MLTSHTMAVIREKQEIKHECRPYVRRVWILAIFTAALIIGWSALTFTIYHHNKEAQRVESSR